MIINKIILDDITSKNAGTLPEISTAPCRYHIPVYSGAGSANAGSGKDESNASIQRMPDDNK